jgi:hypothetical protein
VYNIALNTAVYAVNFVLHGKMPVLHNAILLQNWANRHPMYTKWK